MIAIRAMLAVPLVAVLLAGCSAGPPPGQRLRPPPAGESYADAGSLVAAGIALRQLAREEGQWAAMRELAAADAVLFAPGPVPARDWLDRRADSPAEQVARSVTQVVLSCDGQTGATFGEASWPDGRRGSYTMIWQREAGGSRGDRRRAAEQGGWRWRVSHEVPGAQLAPREADAPVSTRIAACARPVAPGAAAIPVAGGIAGASPDGTLRWSALAEPDGRRSVVVMLFDGSGWATVIDDRVPAPAG